jgi:hypothetical protein
MISKDKLPVWDKPIKGFVPVLKLFRKEKIDGSSDVKRETIPTRRDESK